MKKRILALLLSVIMVVGLLPTTALAAGATDTWAVKLHVSENEDYTYNGKKAIAIGFGVQSDNLTLKNLQSIMFAIDSSIFDLLKWNASWDGVEKSTLSLTNSFQQDAETPCLGAKLNPMASWAPKVYYAKGSGNTVFVLFQPAQDTLSYSVTTEKIISTLYLGLASGKTVADIKADSIRFATRDECEPLAQSSVVSLTDGDKNTQYAWERTGKADTLTVAPAISWDGISVDGTPVTAVTFDLSGYAVGSQVTASTLSVTTTPTGALLPVAAYGTTSTSTTSYRIGTGYDATKDMLSGSITDDSVTFAAGTDYYLAVLMVAESGYSLADLTNVTLNGKTATDLVQISNTRVSAVFKLDPLTAAHEHSYGDWVNEVPATCTTPGTKGHKDCTGCSKHFDSSGNEITDLTIPVDSTKHTFGEWKTEVPATCTTTGTKGHKDCTSCGKHFDNSGNEITDLTIPVDSSKHAEVLGTTWKQSETHHWHEYPCCNAKADEAEHTYTDDADTTCNTCNYERTIAHVHSFGEWKAEVPATCKATGTKGHKDCTGCSKHFDNSDNEITDLTIPVDSNNHAETLDTTTWKKNDTNHWHEYPCCGAKADEAPHTFADNATACSAGCGQTRKLDQTIIASNVTVTYGDTTAKINATAQTTPYYEVISGTDVIAVNSNGNLTLKKAGTATVKITANGNDTYNAAEAITVTVTVAKKEIEIFTAGASGRPYEAGNRNVTFAGASFVDNSSETIYLTKDVDYTGTAVMEDDTANEGGKPVTITITLIGTAKDCYELKRSTYSSFVSISKIDPPDPTGLTGRIGNKLSTVLLPEGWAWVNGDTYMTQREAQYEVTYTGTVNYHPWTVSDGHKLTVTASSKLAQDLNIPDTINVTYGDTNVSIAPTGAHGTVTYTESSDAVDVDANGNVTILKAGTALVSVSTMGDADYALAFKNVTINVSKKALIVTANSPSIYVGEALPELTGAYTVSGLVNSDTVDVSLAYAAAPDTTRAGSYDIIVTATADTDKYELTTVNGTLTIKTRDIIYVPPVIAPTPAAANSITVAPSQNGTAAADRKSASAGTTVTITTAPSKGYELESLTVLDANGRELPLSDKGNGRYTFQMPASNVTVAATFAESNAMLNFFVDVPADAYYAEAVLWAAENGITGGVDEVHFAPDGACTRAQIVTFLWRAAGSPEPKTTSDFTDVPAAAYYAKAVAWAVENGITGGVGDGKFAPDATCTRAQAVTFLFRAAGSPTVEQLAAFGDVAEDAYYAEAVAWAAENGITGGIGGGLFGSGDNCTRAQIVTFLYRSVK